jgi:hypothetical protein
MALLETLEASDIVSPAKSFVVLTRYVLQTDGLLKWTYDLMADAGKCFRWTAHLLSRTYILIDSLPVNSWLWTTTN